MPDVKIEVLGAGGEVGRSCFLISCFDRSLLIDTGVHMSPVHPSDRIPTIPSNIDVSAIIVTHYHLDHIGALPYLRQISGSESIKSCDVYMTSPTCLLAPNVLSDYCRSGPNSDLYTPNHVSRCFEKVQLMPLDSEVFPISNCDLSVSAFHSGHVLGGVGLVLKYRGATVVYTGDFSVIPDSLLRPIEVPQMRIPRGGVDVIISEATHATRKVDRSISESEKAFCKRVEAALGRGGTVLIPVFAVGRTQELASVIRNHLGPRPKLYTTSESGIKASVISQSLARSWTRSGDSTAINDLDVLLLRDTDGLPTGPCVIFTSPAMLEGGTSLNLFKQLCGDSSNLVVLTGYCNKDTVGNSVILFASRRVPQREIVIHGEKVIVRCECYYEPFSNHSDSPGIESVIRRFVPHNIVLVHGDKARMEKFSEKVKETWAQQVDIMIPNNGAVLGYQINKVCKDFPDPLKRLKIRRTVNNSQIGLMEVSETLSKVHKDLQLGSSTDGIQVRKGDWSLELKRDQSTTCFDYTAGLCYQSAEWVVYNPLLARVKDSISSISSDNFSISECSD